MKKPNHNQFIQTSITKILEEMITASRGVGDGIETYAVYDYILQSTFLKMTGAQEQKFKCICWELATNKLYNDIVKSNDIEISNDKMDTIKSIFQNLASNNYDFGNNFLVISEKTLSKYSEKFQVYKDLINQIKIYDSSFDVGTFLQDSDKQKIIDENIYTKIDNILEHTHFKSWLGNRLIDFNANKIQKENFLVKPKPSDNNIILLSKELQERYTQLYNYRNRCAHNTLSYQQNLPTLDTLRKEEYKYENYFVYFSILILIDEIIMALYRKYLEVLE